MGRLIDADELKKNIAKWLKPSSPDEREMVTVDDIAISVMIEIEEQPTAYDVDKVVEQLETGLEEILYDRCYSNDYDMGMKEVNALLDKVMKGDVKDD